MYRQTEYEKFKLKKDKLMSELDKYKSKNSKVSVLRAITFICGFCLVAVGISDNMSLFWVLGILFFIGFIALVRYHSIIDRKLNIINSKHQVISEFCLRFEDKWNSFKDTGMEFIDGANFLVTDVDILGPNSLYQKVNLCNTLYGRRRLAKVLSLENVADDRALRHESILELTEDIDFVVDFTGGTRRLASEKLRTEKIDEFIEYCNDKEGGVLPCWAKLVSVVFPFVELAFVLAWLTGLLHYGFPLAGLLVLVSFSMVTRCVTERVIGPLYVMGVMLENYIEVLMLVDKKEFKSEKLKTISEKLCGRQGALVALNKLKTVIQAYNISYNPIIHQLLCGTLLWDYQLAKLMEKWKKNYGSNLSDSFELIGELEELLSLANIGILHQHCYGDIKQEDTGLFFRAKEIYHPLINQGKVVSNDAELKNGITIITGSNMSGKTTFLRTMAINLVLAYIGAPVCAKSLTASYMKIFTSMRVTDDVANGISTFYAEILRIKNMSEHKNSGEPMLCLIDEIFKGTNSADRIVGAKEVVTKLSGDSSMVVVSTHDFELCSLRDEKDRQVINYHFEEYYDNDQLMFDYKIKDGRCTTTNAKAILKMAGFDV